MDRPNGTIAPRNTTPPLRKRASGRLGPVFAAAYLRIQHASPPIDGFYSISTSLDTRARLSRSIKNMIARGSFGRDGTLRPF